MTAIGLETDWEQEEQILENENNVDLNDITCSEWIQEEVILGNGN